jgi:hypothetical protein
MVEWPLRDGYIAAWALCCLGLSAWVCGAWVLATSVWVTPETWMAWAAWSSLLLLAGIHRLRWFLRAQSVACVRWSGSRWAWVSAQQVSELSDLVLGWDGGGWMLLRLQRATPRFDGPCWVLVRSHAQPENWHAWRVAVLNAQANPTLAVSALGVGP